MTRMEWSAELARAGLDDYLAYALADDSESLEDFHFDGEEEGEELCQKD